MSEDCVSCGSRVRPRQEALQCNRCDLWQHRTCDSGISREYYRRMVKGEVDVEWLCCNCKTIDMSNGDAFEESNGDDIQDSLRDDIQDSNGDGSFDISNRSVVRGRHLQGCSGPICTVIQVLRALLRHLPEGPRVQCIVADFEAAFWKAVDSVWGGDMEVRGCSFHWGQAVNHKVAELGLQTAYRSDDAVHNFVRKILALPFLPAEHIRYAYQQLVERATASPLRSLLDYVGSTWVNNSLWTPASWSVFMRPVRTNNDVEGWHRRLSAQARDSKPSVYVLIDLLQKEADLLPIQLRMVSEGKLTRRFTKKANSQQGRIFQLWTDYEKDDITVSQLLTRCGAIYRT